MVKIGGPGGRVAPDVPGGLFWTATLATASTTDGVRFFECERMIDVRKIAEVLLGGDVVVRPSVAAFPRTQIRWAGSAMGINDLHREVRTLGLDGKPEGKWRDPRRL